MRKYASNEVGLPLKKKYIFGQIDKKDIVGWLIMLPSFMLFIVFVWHPLISGVILSFFKTEGFHAVSFNGFANYISVISDSAFKTAFINTFSYTFWSIALGYLVPIVFAILVNEIVHFKTFFKFSLYFPSMVPGIAVLIMWGFLFDASSGGVLNSILIRLGFSPLQWLQNEHLTIALIILTMVWRAFGGTMLIYLAALQNISQELYEAATLDGASLWKRVWHVTLPQMSSVLKLTFILQIISIFQIMYEPFVMTGGGPNNASLSLMLLNYQYGFIKYEAGKAMAVGSIVCVILMILSSVYFKATKSSKFD